MVSGSGIDGGHESQKQRFYIVTHYFRIFIHRRGSLVTSGGLLRRQRAEQPRDLTQNVGDWDMGKHVRLTRLLERF